MTDRKTVLKCAHLGAGSTGRACEIVEAQGRVHAALVAEIQAEQEALVKSGLVRLYILRG